MALRAFPMSHRLHKGVGIRGRAATAASTSHLLVQYGVPVHLREGLRRYVDERVAPGAFLRAVLENDLKEAVSRGDTASMEGLTSMVGYLFNQAPESCWGSKEAVKKWLGER